MMTSKHTRGLMVLVMAIAAGSGCSSDKDKKKDKNKPKAGKTASKAKPTAARGGGFGCDIVKRMDKDGEITAIEHLAGKDDLGMEVVGGKVALRAGSTMTGSIIRFQMRGSYAEVENQGRKACVAISRLTFSFPRFKPELNKTVPYKFSGKLQDISRGRIPLVYVDINENKSIAGSAAQTIEYLGTEGSYKFTKLNEPDARGNKHTLEFSVVFEKVTAAKLDPSVKTKLTGSFSLRTRRPL